MGTSRSAANRGPVLVVGAGFIGSHVAREFLRSGADTRILTRSGLTSPVGLGGATVIQGDAADPHLLQEALKEVTQVVYCAGGLMPADSALEPLTDVRLSLAPLITVLEALRHSPGTGLTFLSSGGTVYGVPLRVPVDEDHPTEPSCPYGITKLASEKYIGLYHRLHGIPARVLRCSNVYGEGQPPDRGQGVIATWLHHILHGKPITIFGDGTTVRDYLYVGDLAALIVGLSHRTDCPGLLNAGSGQGTSLNEMVGHIQDVTGGPLTARYVQERSVDIPRVVLDITRIRQFTDFEPTPLPVGLERTWSAVTTRGNAPAAPQEPMEVGDSGRR